MKALKDYVLGLDEATRSLLETGAPVFLPDINRSKEQLAIEGESLRMGLDCIIGLSSKQIFAILDARKAGEFEGFCDLLVRTPLLRRNSEDIDNLIRCGAFDCFGHSREAMLNWRGTDSLRTETKLEDLLCGFLQPDLTGDLDDPFQGESKDSVLNAIEKRIASDAVTGNSGTLISLERQSLKCRPYELQLVPYAKTLESLRLYNPRTTRHIRYGQIVNIRHLCNFNPETKRKENAVYALFEDARGISRIKLSITKKKFKALKIRERALVEIKQRPYDSEDSHLQVEYIHRAPLASEMMKKVIVRLNAGELSPMKVHQMKTVLEGCPGMDSICLSLSGSETSYEATLPLRINADMPVFSYLCGIFDDVGIKVIPNDDLY